MPEEVEVTTPVETQEEQAAPSTEEQNESTESATGEEEQQESQAEGEGQKSKGGFQRRIDRLTKEKSDIEREKEFWRQEALRNLPKDEKPAEEAPKTPDKPTRESYASDEEFQEALTDWKVDRRFEQEAQKQEQKAAAQPLFEARTKFAATVEDFHETMRAATNVPVTENMLPYLKDPEIGPELGYFLAKNPDEAAKLSKMGPVILARTIVELQPRFKPDASAETPQKTVSKAPPPPTTAAKTSTQTTKDPGDMTPAEYRAWRAKTYPDL